ncbi:MAG TPA: hypothetical protein VIX63_10365 [Vicinamibacterales bacterium]
MTLSAVERSGHSERRRGRPRRAAGLGLTLVGILATTRAAAQGPPAPPGPYVLDVRGVSSGVPEGAAFFPPLAAGLPIPTRALGFDIGAHVYAGRLGQARLGFGASLMNVRTEEFPPQAAPSTATSSPPAGPPGLHVDMRALVPQVSFNFGTADGWSYLSAGAGFTEVTARPVDGVDARRSSGRVMTINAGGGARWFLTRRVAFGFDARLHRVTAADTMPASMLFSIAAGISLR